MAMPVDFWRNEQSLNIFRTKPCQRLCRDAVCEWRSQCQYSHCLEWPRRPPQKHNYSPEICSQIRVTHGPNGEALIENGCNLGQKCQLAHSKEEILWHPDIFKTTLCEEFMGTNGNQRNARNGKHNRCHRYYCPFAHGPQELLPSRLSEDERRDLIQRALQLFPSDECCGFCSPHRLKPPGAQVMGFLPSNGLCSPCQQQEVASPPHSPPAGYWQVNTQALHDGQGDGKNHYPTSPYALQHQQLPANAHLVAVRPQWASPDHSQFAMTQAQIGNDGCGLVVPNPQMSQEVVGSMAGQGTNGAPTGSAGMQQQMIVMGSPMGCGMGSPVAHSPNALPMVQLTPMGQQAPNGGMAHMGGSSMQMVQVTPVNTGAGHDSLAANSSEVVANLLRTAGLERFVEVFRRKGLLELEPEAIAAMTPEKYGPLGMSAVEQASLKHVIDEMQPKANRGNMVMMPGSAPRTPNLPPQQQLVMVNSADMYGQWMPATSPGPMSNEGNVHPYGYQQLSPPWGNSNGIAHQQHPAMMAQFVANVPGDQRSVQNAHQVVQHQDVQMFFPPVPQFPFQPQAMAQMQQSGGQNGAHCAMSPQMQRGNANGSPAMHMQPQPYVQPGPQMQAHQPQLQPPPRSSPPINGRQGSQHSLSEDSCSPASQQTADTSSEASPQRQSNSTAPWLQSSSTSLEPASETRPSASTKLRKRNQKLVPPLKIVERLLENVQPPILNQTELQRRLTSDSITLDNKLLQQLEASPNFIVHGQWVTLTKYSQTPEMQHLLEDDDPR